MIKRLLLLAQSLLIGSSLIMPATALAIGSPNCYKTFLGVKPWYQYLEVVETSDKGCVIQYPGEISETVYKVVVAAVDALVRIAGIVAFVFLIISGFRFVLSQGDPSKEKAARSAALNSVIGMVIAISATALVGFIMDSII